MTDTTRTFPTTLAEIGSHAPQLWHVTAEYGGRRYYVGSDVTSDGAEKIANQYREHYPAARILLHNGPDATRIDGAWNELIAAYRRDHEPADAPFYRCPACGSTDLRVEIPFVHVLNPDGVLEMCDYVVEHIQEVTEPGAALCNNEECEYTGPFEDFVAADPDPAAVQEGCAYERAFGDRSDVG